jgi:hypothetical protein
MGYDVTETQGPVGVRWTQRAPTEIEVHLANSITEKETLQQRLAELVKENSLLKVRCSIITRELAKERQHFQGEIEALNSKVTAAENAFNKTGNGRLIAESAARERLMKDEFERTVQSLRVDLKMERQRHATQLKAMKDRAENCICGEFRAEKSLQKSTLPPGLLGRWAAHREKQRLAR